MEDVELPRDRAIRAEALSSAAVVLTRVKDADVPKDTSIGVVLAGLSHSFAHYIHSGEREWLTKPENTCPFGSKCRFGGAS